MIFVDAVYPDETYSLEDVFGHEPIYYPHSLLRIAGWETPVSFIYQQNNEIMLRYKTALLTYATGFEDPPFSCPAPFANSAFYDAMAGNYIKAQSQRRLAYALQQYQHVQQTFSPIKLLPGELAQRLNTTSLLPPISLLEDHQTLFRADSYWFPVAEDTILIEFANRRVIHGDEVALLNSNGEIQFGHIGFDRRFYRFWMQEGRWNSSVYSLENRVLRSKAPGWLLSPASYGLGYRFLKDYVITPDLCCYSYAGHLLEHKTRHHQNVKLLNDILRLLWSAPANEVLTGPATRLIVPREFVTFHIRDVDQVLVPHLSSNQALNPKAYAHFVEVQRLIEQTGLQERFETALRNMMELNRYPVYGGSNRAICSNTLLRHLHTLYEKEGKEICASLLQDVIELKKHVAKLNGKVVLDVAVSAEDYQYIHAQRTLPPPLKGTDFWASIPPGALVVFTHDGNEKFCAVISHTKSGLRFKSA